MSDERPTTPPWAVDQLTGAGGVQAGPYLVRDVTVALLALLERIDSPLHTGKPAPAAEWLPTLYVLTRPARESSRILAKGKQAWADAVADWADTVPAHLGPKLILAAREVAARLNRAVEADGDGSEEPSGPPPHAETAG